MTESMLELQDAELLPVREALQGFNTVTNIIANVAVAVPEEDGDAVAYANQTVVLLQEVD